MTNYTQILKKWFSEDHPINAVKASAEIGSGDDGTVAIEYDLVGTEGNDYSIIVSDENDGDDDVDLSVELVDNVITVKLGTDADSNSSATIGSGVNGTVTVEVDPTGVDENDYTIEVVEGADSADMSAALVSENITVTLGMTTALSAVASIGSGGNGTVEITVDEAGEAGNDYTVEVIAGSGALNVNLTGTTLVVTLATGGSTATAVADAINAAYSSTLTAVASGTGATSLTLAENVQSFIGGAESIPDDTKNTATLIAAEIDLISGVTATASGNGSSPITQAEQKSFSGGSDTGAISPTKNTATLIAQAISELDNFTATASGDGSTPILVAEEEKSLEGGQYATESYTPAIIIIDDVWYICDSPVDKYNENGWKSGTPIGI